jgi:alkylation response protein AidB-like acyl-CoA dehydrogenase
MSSALTRAAALLPLIREHADASESQRRLHPAVASAFATSGLYRLGVPTSAGGEGGDPKTQIEVIECASTADGSAGWNLMIGIESFGLIVPGFRDCKDLVADPLEVICGSTAAVGTATPDGEGYRINGVWQFVSGCHNAGLFGATIANPNGNGNRYAILTRGQWEILDTWHVSGMRGSGSHDVRVVDAWVPRSRIVAPIGGVKSDDPLLRFPVGARLAYNKVAVALGIARHAIDFFLELTEGKQPRFSSGKLRDRVHAQTAAAEAEVRIVRSRAALMEQVESMWGKNLQGANISTRDRAIFQIVCSDGVRACVEAVDLIADAAGTSANQLGSALERAARDVRVVRQHASVASHHIADGGRALVGLAPQGLMLAGLSPSPKASAERSSLLSEREGG